MNKCPDLRDTTLAFALAALMPFQSYALDCPKMPEQARKDWQVEVKAAVARIGPARGAELETVTKTVTRDLMSKLPQADKVYLEQMMYATYCSALRDDKVLSEAERANRIKAYNLEVRKTLYGQQGKPQGKESRDRQGSIRPNGPTRCIVDAKISADVVSRVFARDTFKSGEQILYPSFQELFYEWSVLLSADNQAKDVFLEIHNLHADDRVSMIPSIGTLSEPQGRWYSGFPEPRRSKPDYFVRTVKLKELSPQTSSVTVAVRRFLEKPLISSNDLIRIKTASASNCSVKLKPILYAGNAELLQLRARSLAENVYQISEGRHPIPIARDPGDLKKHEAQATVEVRCETESCSKMNMGQLEARVGQAPDDAAKEQRTNKLLQLKKDLEEVFKCIKGPYDNDHPTREAQVIETCDEPRHLSAEEMERLISVLKKHGAGLRGVQPKGPASE